MKAGPNLETLLSATDDSPRKMDPTFWVERHLAEHVRRMLIQAQVLRDEIEHLEDENARLEAEVCQTVVEREEVVSHVRVEST